MDSMPSDKSRARGQWAWRSDLLVFLGLALLSYGAWLFHHGAGSIVLGLALILIGTRGLAD